MDPRTICIVQTCALGILRPTILYQGCIYSKNIIFFTPHFQHGYFPPIENTWLPLRVFHIFPPKWSRGIFFTPPEGGGLFWKIYTPDIHTYIYIIYMNVYMYIYIHIYTIYIIYIYIIYYII